MNPRVATCSPAAHTRNCTTSPGRSAGQNPQNKSKSNQVIDTAGGQETEINAPPHRSSGIWTLKAKGGSKGQGKGPGQKCKGKGQFLGTCWNCNKKGHRSHECPNPKVTNGIDDEEDVAEVGCVPCGGAWMVAAVETNGPNGSDDAG